ncbi:protein kinase domain-containing protein [Streptomyces sp. NPDC002913]
MNALKPDDPQWVGPYRLDRRLGEGGMGQVFLGTSPGGRKVAVKVIRPELADTPQFRQRFAREVDAARRVGGFHTAQVVDADPEARSPWLVTAFVPGPTLHEAVREKGVLAPDAVLRLGAGLAEGLAAIHRCGLVHRDLKPGNIILADDGPRIIDFGIARAMDASSLTATGTIIGTYAYMSPEQIRTDRAGPASDVFSLGSVLTFAATGHGPFDAPSLVEVVQLILDEQPSLGRLDGELHGLLTACLTKDHAGRPSLAELQSRLARLPTGTAAPEQVPGPAADAPTLPVAGQEPERTMLLGGPEPSLPTSPTAPYPPEYVLAHPAAEPAPVSPGTPTGGVSRRALVIGGVAAAATAATVVGIPLLLREKDEDTGGSSPSSGSTALKGPTGLRAISFGLDGKTLLGAGADSVWSWDIPSKRGTSTRISGEKYLQANIFSPDRKLLIRAEENKVVLWDVVSGRVAKILDGPPKGDLQEGFVHALAISPDGKTLAGALAEDLYVWDVPSGRKLDVRKGGHSGPLAFTPDSKQLVTARPLVLRELPSLRSVVTIDEERTNRETAVFSPDGQLLAVSQMDGSIKLWNAASRRQVVMLKGHRQEVTTLAFHPTAGTLASGSGDGAVRLWDTATGRTTAAFTCPQAVESVAFSPDGKTVAAGFTTYTPSDDTALLWPVP